MAKLDDVYGPRDDDVLAFREGIGGLVFDGWSDEKIAEVAIEEANIARADLAEITASMMAAKGRE
jgi:hypothetical protein